jgi:hypothetical protein
MRLSIIICYLFLFIAGEINSCNSPCDSLPQGAVPFTDFKNNVMLDGVLNDSIPIKALLDIGAWGVAVPSQANPDNREYVTFEINGLKKRMRATPMAENSQFLNWYGGHCVLLGWDFFDRRILEISYKGKYIRMLKQVELDSIKSGYDCIPFRNRGMRLVVNGTVSIGDKQIEGDFWLDTGLNGLLFMTDNIVAEYGLTFDRTKKGRARNMDSGLANINMLKADSIRIGNSCLTDKDVIFTQSEWFVFKENDIYIGLLGNQFFKNFSAIFDFRQNILYLKAY